MLFRQDFVCYRYFRWKTEDSDKALRNDIFSGDSWFPLRYPFGIHFKNMKQGGVSLKQAKENATQIDN